MMKLLLPFQKGLKVFFGNPMLTFFSITVLTSVILVSQVFLVLGFSINNYFQGLTLISEVRLYLDNISTDEAEALGSKILEEGDVTHVRYLNSEEVYRASVSLGGDSVPNTDASQYFPGMLLIGTKSAGGETSALEGIIDKYGDADGVIYASYGKDIVSKLRILYYYISAGVLLLGGLLFLVLTFITYVVIKLTLYRLAKEIEVYSIVGATLMFISIAYVMDVVIKLVVSFVVAYLLLLLLAYYTLSVLLNVDFASYLVYPPTTYFVYLFVAILVSGVLSSYAGVRSFIHSTQ